MSPPRIIPPVYLLASATAMVALHRFFPIRHLIGWPWRWAGVALIVAGLALGGWAVGLFKSRNTTLRPGHSSTRLVTDGPFRFSRNPMYVAMTIMLAGVAVTLGSLSPWMVLPVFVWVIGRNIIPVEEAMLGETFGEEYRHYRGRVRRWI